MREMNIIPMKNLQALEEFNKEIEGFYKARTESHPNGIACPKCGKELWDTEPTITLDSNPPQKSIHCPSCGFKGLRLT